MACLSLLARRLHESWVMKVLVTGSKGQLGWELQRSQPKGADVVWTDVAELDIADLAAVNKLVKSVNPAVIINAAAYTAVDKAESQAELSFKINRDGAGNLAKAAQLIGSRLLHVSTDFVFDGQGKPYQTGDAVNPLSVYGASKFEGEQAVLAGCDKALVVRTAWVYCSHGGNFVKTMLKLMAEKPALSVVCDQVGSPTWAKGLATTLWTYSQLPKAASGVVHYTDSGVASWYDFAVAIQEEALKLGLLKVAVPIAPIPASQYPTPAKRPGFSVLDKSSSEVVVGTAPHWRVQLREMLKELV
jgi:dTDP-4-dehydrorhamnose reductase